MRFRPRSQQLIVERLGATRSFACRVSSAASRHRACRSARATRWRPHRDLSADGGACAAAWSPASAAARRRPARGRRSPRRPAIPRDAGPSPAGLAALPRSTTAEAAAAPAQLGRVWASGNRGATSASSHHLVPNGEQAVVVRLGAQQVEERRWRRRYACVAWWEYGVHEDRGDDPTLHHQFRDIGAGVAVRHQHKVLPRRQRRKEGGEGARSARVRSQRTSWCAIHGRRGPGPPAARRRDREAGWQAEPTTEPSLEDYEQGGALWARLCGRQPTLTGGHADVGVIVCSAPLMGFCATLVGCRSSRAALTTGPSRY